MNKGMTRREWINRSATVFGGSLLGAVAGVQSLNAASTATLLDKPVRMMFNENPYGPSQIARRAMRKAFEESNLYSMRGAKGEFKIGLPELAIGMSLPLFATELAKDRISKRLYI